MDFTAAVYGVLPRDVVEPPSGARQVSPLIPGSADLAELPEASLDEAVLLVPPGAVEARYTLALALKALHPGGRLTAAAPKDRGGLRLKKTLQGFGCTVDETSRRHHRICVVRRPEEVVGLEATLAEGAPRRLGEFWSQPGVFSWDRLDPGTALLLRHLPALSGHGADLGCGVGVLAKAVLAASEVRRLMGVDIDRRAIAAARRNVEDPRAAFLWADVRQAGLTDLDFVVMNPPFHEQGAEDKGLGQAFIRAAATALRKGGTLHLVANRHLPYEAILQEAFARTALVADEAGFKVYEARR